MERQESLYIVFFENINKILSEENIRFRGGTGDQTRKGIQPEDANTTNTCMENAITYEQAFQHTKKSDKHLRGNSYYSSECV